MSVVVYFTIRDSWVVCALWITFCWFVGSTVHGEHETSLVTDSQFMTVRKGSDVHLNCTITGYGNGRAQLVAGDLLWSRGHKQLTNTHILNNRTLQLTIKSVSWSDAGNYWCRSSPNHQITGVRVSLIVGDIPSPPQIVKWENLEMTLKLYWAAPSYVGGLPLTYSLKHEKCDDCVFSYYKENSFQDGLYSNVYSVTAYENHTVWIEAQNSLGISQSKSVDIYLTMDIETVYPCPPIVSLRGISKAIELHWKVDPKRKECSWSKNKGRIFNISYRYQAKEKSYFKSQTVPSTTQEMIVLDDLKPYTVYEVYVSVQLQLQGSREKIQSHPSSVVGPITARTSEETPNEGPKNISCPAVAWSGQKGKMNITVKWKAPPRTEWNGIIRSFVVMYGYQQNNGTVINYQKFVSGSSRQLVLSGLDASSYHVNVRACTINQEYCTSSERQCTASVSQDATQVAARTSNWLVDYAPAVVGFAVCLGAVLLIVYFWKKRQGLISRPRRRLCEITGGIDVSQNQSEWSSSQSTSPPVYCDIGNSDDRSDSESSDCALLNLGQRNTHI